MEAKPADDPTLQAMTICYREMQKRKEYSNSDFSYLLPLAVSFDTPQTNYSIAGHFLDIICFVWQRKWPIAQ